MTRCSTIALIALSLAACKFPYPGDVPIDAADGPLLDATDAATDAAPIDAPATTIGTFSAAGTLVAGRMDAAAVVIGDRLYVLGGTACAGCAAVTRDAAGITPSVEVAAVSANGPGTFALASSLLRPRAGAVAFRVTRGGSDWLYVLGGYHDASPSTFPLEIERAAIASDGSIGAFADVAGVALDQGRAHAQVLVTADNVYLIGGWLGGSTYAATTSRASIQASGDLGAFTFAGGVTISNSRGRMTQIGGTVTLIAGGHDAAGVPVTNVERATISGASVTGFASAPGLVTARAGATSFALGGRAWVLGGGNVATGAALDSIESAQLSPAGPFVLNSRRLDQPRLLAVGAVLPAHVCVIGGSTSAAPAAILDSVSCAALQ